MSIAGSAGVSAGAELGGEAGDGASSGDVTITNSGASIATADSNSAGIFAQSIGGSGGSGGSALNASVTGGGTAAVSLSATIGGKAGSGGKAGDVSITNSATIQTGSIANDTLFGNYSCHLCPIRWRWWRKRWQCHASQHFWWWKAAVTAGVNIGGAGGSGNTAGSVDVTNTGLSIQTLGDFSTGILAQSIGGGGGSGGSALSVTGGVGSNAVSAGVNLGGDGAAGGSSGSVTVSNTADITTGTNVLSQLYGNNSYGIFAQAVGGGGGAGGEAISGSVTLSTGTNVNAGVSLGGNGGSGSTGGAVSVSNSGSIRTLGNNSAAVYAQSLGGGGGSGGRVINAQLAGSSGGPAVNVGASVGGNGGSGGNAGNVTVINSGSINTGTLFSGDGTVYGDFAYGLFAQSVGGGGGAGGSTINGQLGGAAKPQ